MGRVKEVKVSNTINTMSWDECARILREMFCSRTVIKQLEEEFLRMEQGNVTVRE